MTLITDINKRLEPVNRVPYSAFFIGAIALFTLVILALLFASSLFMNNDSATYDTGRFFAMAKVIVSGATPYLDYQDPKPPLIFFILTVPILLGQQFLGGLLLIGLCNLISAVIVMKIGESLYGRVAGLAAGLLFLVNIGWAQGYFVMTEPFTILFILLATYFALFSKKRHYVLAGLSAGVAIGFKQYALITIPLLLLALYLNKEAKRIPAFITGVTFPLLLIFGSIFFVYGAQAMDASLYWTFGVAGPYVTRNRVDPVISTGTDAVELALNIVIAAIISASLYLGYNRYLKNNKLDANETYFLLSAIGFSLTLLIRQYLHYWALAVPFLAILWASWLFKEQKTTVPDPVAEKGQ